MTWQDLLCAFGVHNTGYKFEHSPFEERGEKKDKVSLVQFCSHCPNGRRTIVKRSLLLGD